MARKNVNEKSLENLSKSRFTPDSARKASAKAAELRKMYKPLKDRIKDRVTAEEWDAIVDAIMGKAKEGDIRSAEFLRDTIGEKPKEEVEMTNDISFAFKGIDDWDELSG